MRIKERGMRNEGAERVRSGAEQRSSEQTDRMDAVAKNGSIIETPVYPFNLYHSISLARPFFVSSPHHLFTHTHTHTCTHSPSLSSYLITPLASSQNPPSSSLSGKVQVSLGGTSTPSENDTCR